MKDRSDEDKKMLKHYIYKLTRNKSKIIIPDLLKKCPELILQTKRTAAQLREQNRFRMSQVCSTEHVETTQERKIKDRLYKSEVRFTENVETTQERNRKNSQHMSQVHLNMKRKKCCTKTNKREEIQEKLNHGNKN